MSEDLELSAKIANLNADTEWKRAMTKWEPWKAMAVAAGAGAAVTAAAIGIITFALAHILR